MNILNNSQLLIFQKLISQKYLIYIGIQFGHTQYFYLHSTLVT